jgi:hypothetical protein
LSAQCFGLIDNGDDQDTFGWENPFQALDSRLEQTTLIDQA